MELKDATNLIKLARNAILKGEVKDETFKEKRGVFVTLETYPEEELRGCIGYPEPIFPLSTGIQKAAMGAANLDPRFNPVSKEEMEEVIVEISILTPAEEIDAKDEKEKLAKIKTGTDGLILKQGFHSGLFLPQVWAHLPNKEMFLDALCQKAGVPEGSWKAKSARLFKFRVEAFIEEKPDGKVKKVKI